MKIYRKGRMFLFLMLVLAAGELLSGCTAKKETGRDINKIVLRYENWEVYPEQLALHQEVVDAFNKTHPRIHVKLEGIESGMKILVEMAGGSGPDIFFWDSGILAPLVTKGTVLNLYPFIQESKDLNPDEYFSGLFDIHRYNEGIYAFPIYWGSSALAYNKVLFDKAGLEYPDESWTWDDFISAGDKLTIKKDGRAVQYGANRPGIYLAMMSFGGTFFNESVTKCTMNESQVKEALQFMVDLERKYQIVPAQAQTIGEKYRGDIELFISGRMGMYIVSTSELPKMRKIKGLEWDISPLPKSSAGRAIGLGAGNLCIPSQSKHPKEAWEFVKFACGKEGSRILGKGGNNIPPIKSLAYSVFSIPPPEHIRIFVETSNYALPPEPATRKEWWEEFRTVVVFQEIEKMLLGKQTVSETVQMIISSANKFLK